MIKLSTFGQRLKKLRLIKNFTQEQLINDFNKKHHYNLSKSAISQYENNKRLPEISVLINFADYFNVSIDFLLCRKNTGNELIEEDAEKYILPKAISKLDLIDLPEELNKLLNSYDYIYFMNKPASKKSIELIKNCIKIGVELAKQEQAKT